MRGASRRRELGAPARLLLAALGSWLLSWTTSLRTATTSRREGVLAFAARSGATSTPPSPSQLLQALGRQLWVAGDELLEVGACLEDLGSGFGQGGRPESPRQLGNGGLALRNAADAILDDDWPSAWGELDVAAASCEAYLPSPAFQGLVDLFGYTEPVPSCEWRAASQSLLSLGTYLRMAAERVRRNPDLRSREQASGGLAASAAALEGAARLFQPGGFFVPPDPRDPWPKDSEPFVAGPWKSDAFAEPQLVPGSYAARLLEEVREELSRASGAAQRRSALRRLVRRSHPDQNPGHEDEVIPILEYVQGMREREGVKR